jgi:hypothetical protein
VSQHRTGKVALRAGMTQAGEPSSEAAGRLGQQGTQAVPRSFLSIASTALGLPEEAMSLVLRHDRETNEYPLIGADAEKRLRIYLDLKDWVALAKARLGRAEFPYDQAAYDRLRAAVTDRQVIVVLSATTYAEVGRISSLRQRTDLADVMAEISGFVTITGRSVALRHQFQTALAARFGGPESAPLRPLGLGIAFATGDRRRLVLRPKDGASPDLPAGQIREIEASGRAILEYEMMRGPRPEDIPQLRAYGYQPDAVTKIETERLAREKQLAAMLAAGTTERARLSDIVHARYLFWELRDYLREDMHPYGVTIDEFFAKGKAWLNAFLDDIPAAAITITLTEKGFRNRDKEWKGNDLRDADAMSAAIPYCDVVLTDKYVAAQLAKSSAVTRQDTMVLPRLRDLAARLPDLIKGHNSD